MPSRAEYLEDSELFFEHITNGREKIAEEVGTDWTRTTIREDGVTRRVLPFEQNVKLDRSVTTNKNVKIVDREPQTPGAVVINFRAQPDAWYIDSFRYEVPFHRIHSPCFVVDTDEIRTYHMDIRAVIQDNAAKDIYYKEDEDFFAAANAIMLSADTVMPWTGISQWRTQYGGISRSTWQESLKTLNESDFRLSPHTTVAANVTMREFMKWGRDEVGDDWSGKTLRDGFSEENFSSTRMLVTNKLRIVPANTTYNFAAPEALGKAYSMYDATLFLKREKTMVMMELYEYIGVAIGHSGAVARNDFV